MKCIVKNYLEEIDNSNLPVFVPIEFNINIVGNGVLPIITMETTLPNATIYYTTDGSTPSTSNGSVYNGIFYLEQSCTLKAIAISVDAQTSVESRNIVYSATKSVLANEVSISNGSANYTTSMSVVNGDIVVMSLSDFSITGEGSLTINLERGSYTAGLKNYRDTNMTNVLAGCNMFAFVVSGGTDSDVEANKPVVAIGPTTLIRVKSFTGVIQQGHSISAYSFKASVIVYRPA